MRALAPDGVDAVFDHVGGPGLDNSWRMLAPRGVLVSYGTAATRDVPGDPMEPMLGLIARLDAFNREPGERRATFFNLWEGVDERDRFRREQRADLTRVFDLLASGALTPHVAARLPLDRAGEALRIAEQGGLVGKIVLIPA